MRSQLGYRLACFLLLAAIINTEAAHADEQSSLDNCISHDADANNDANSDSIESVSIKINPIFDETNTSKGGCARSMDLSARRNIFTCGRQYQLQLRPARLKFFRARQNP
jgi:hypothetical protein